MKNIVLTDVLRGWIRTDNGNYRSSTFTYNVETYSQYPEPGFSICHYTVVLENLVGDQSSFSISAYSKQIVVIMSAFEFVPYKGGASITTLLKSVTLIPDNAYQRDHRKCIKSGATKPFRELVTDALPTRIVD